MCFGSIPAINKISANEIYSQRIKVTAIIVDSTKIRHRFEVFRTSCEVARRMKDCIVCIGPPLFQSYIRRRKDPRKDYSDDCIDYYSGYCTKTFSFYT